MLNYMKSEWYRVTHCSTIYTLTFVLAVLTLVLNGVLYVLGKMDAGFPYGTVSFSLSNLVCSLPVIFFTGLVVVGLLFFNDKRNGLLKNALASGISREKMFLARCVVCVAASFISLAVILVVYIGSAVLLFPMGVEPDAVGILLRGVLYTLPMAVACQILAVAFLDFMDKELIGCLGWYIFVGLIPKCCALLGLRFPMWKRVADWMPVNFFSQGANVNMSGWNCMWETPDGMAKCLIAGSVGLVVFLVLGFSMCRKQEH